MYVSVVTRLKKIACLGIMIAQLEATLKPLRPSQHSIVLASLRGALNWSPLMPRGASHSKQPMRILRVALGYHPAILVALKKMLQHIRHFKAIYFYIMNNFEKLSLFRVQDLDFFFLVMDTRFDWIEFHLPFIRAIHICTQKNIFEILLNQTEIRLYLSFSDWFEKSENREYNMISV